MALPVDQDPGADARLIDEAVAVMRDAKARVPQDFLFAIAVLLAGVALGLLVLASVTGGVAQDLLLNLCAEVAGALLTVVVIDGLWRRREAATSASLDATSQRLAERKGSPLDEQERQAWRSLVDEYHALVRAESPIQRVLAVPRYGSRLQQLEAKAIRTLDGTP